MDRFRVAVRLGLVLASIANCPTSSGRTAPHGGEVVFHPKASVGGPRPAVDGSPRKTARHPSYNVSAEEEDDAPRREVAVRGELQFGVDHPVEELPEEMLSVPWDGVVWTVRCLPELWADEGDFLHCVSERATLVLDGILAAQQAGIAGPHDVGFSARKKKAHRHVKHFLKIMHALAKLLLLGLPFLFFIKFKAIMLVSFAVGSIVLLAGKSIILAIVSFALSMIAALRNPSPGSHHHHDDLRREDVQLLEGGRRVPGLFM